MSTDAVLQNIVCDPLIVQEHTPLEISDSEYAQISQILLAARGFNLESYKDKCVRRRISIRIRANHCETVKEYCDLLVSHKPELDLLLKVLTIHVSQFFRNRPAFEKLRQEIIPLLFANARQRGLKELVFWSLGCAGGEEPYTLALILAKHFAGEMTDIPVRIVAVDVDAATLSQAQRAVFNHDKLRELPIDYLQCFFAENGTQYQLAPEITAMVTFRLGDMFDDDLYQPCDLILCRNVMIYFSREQQNRIFSNIAKVLRHGGFLVLGKSETILGESRALFRTVCPVERIYCCS